jgi:hypothetical protein
MKNLEISSKWPWIKSGKGSKFFQNPNNPRKVFSTHKYTSNFLLGWKGSRMHLVKKKMQIVLKKIQIPWVSSRYNLKKKIIIKRINKLIQVEKIEKN